jgi:hypothetical protein
MNKYTVTFQVNKYDESTPALLESELQDLLINAVLPALNSELVPLTMTVKAARK